MSFSEVKGSSDLLQIVKQKCDSAKRLRYCVQNRSKNLEDERKRVAAIFVGEVESQAEERKGKLSQVVSQVKVIRAWQGPMHMTHAIGEGYCPIKLEKGKKYLFFAEAGGAQLLVVSARHWTQELIEAADVIKQLGQGWSFDKNSVDRLFPTNNEHLKCPDAAKVKSYLYQDSSKSYWCDVNDKSIATPRIDVYASGTLKKRGLVRGGLSIGKHEYFDENGKKIKEVEYDENGNVTCQLPSNLIKDSDYLIGYLKDSFYPLAVISDKKILSPLNFNLSKVKNAALISTQLKEQSSLTWQTLYRDAHFDHCIQAASVTFKNKNDRTLASSASFKHQPPTPDDLKLFYSVKKECVNQGDEPPDKMPPCSKPQVLIVTDIDENGAKEFWHTQPYMWDTGMVVTEIHPKTKVQKKLVSDCSDCSD